MFGMVFYLSFNPQLYHMLQANNEDHPQTRAAEGIAITSTFVEDPTIT
jgi:hypothetical protein